MKEPKTYLVGYTTFSPEGIKEYLKETEQREFLDEFNAGLLSGLSGGECLVSMFAKMCYKSLVLGRNENVSKTRSIQKNLESVVKSGHGSVFEHCWINFITTNCSRIFTHELCRHRVGTAFSQTSGRYCAIDESLDIVFPSEYLTDEVQKTIEQHRQKTVEAARKLQGELIPSDADFTTKKKLTSAIRRLAPNGQTNEIAWSANLRALRHMIEMRTSRHAEWEIRLVFNQVVELVKKRWPTILYGAEVEEVDGMKEYRNLRI